MYKFVFVVNVILYASCSSPTYHFGSSDSHQNDNSHQSKKIPWTKNDPATASLSPVIYGEVKAAPDTAIVAVDSISQQKPDRPTDSYQRKAERKRLHQEKKKVYQDTRKANAATKDKRFNDFAIAGAVFFTASFLCMFPRRLLFLRF